MSRGKDWGGDWTEDKLKRLEKYLNAYMKVMKDRPFKLAYIDAFAGAGYRETAVSDEEPQLFRDAIEEESSQRFLRGSASIALDIEPPFHRYIFIEKTKKNVGRLSVLQDEFPKRQVEIKPGDANTILRDICAKNWDRHRAVLFLDPYGMQVEWATVEAIAATRAIDLWILFPSGVAVNRLLKRDAEIPPGWRRRLDSVFGNGDWFSRFYAEVTREDMFGESKTLAKEVTIKAIGDYYVERLGGIFEHVADNPLALATPNGNPLYLLCFAAGNPRGGKTAVKIAQDILGR